MLGVLRHFQCGNADASGIDRFGGSHDDPLLGTKVLQCLVGGGHIGDLNVVLDPVGRNLLCRTQIHIILSGGRHENIGLGAPGLFTLEKGYLEFFGIILHPVSVGSPHFQKVIDLFFGRGNPFFV